MEQLGRLLVVDDSAVVRELLTVVFAPHCSEIRSSESALKAIRTLGDDRAFDLVLCDVETPEGDGFDVLEYLSLLEGPRPGAVLVTARPRAEDARRAAELGALGYVAKPVSLRSLLAALRQSGRDWDPMRAGRRRSDGTARVVDAKATHRDAVQEGEMEWDLTNLSASGAFLETPGPVPIGTQLELRLALGASVVPARARVVRVQEPAWSQPGGVGVRFEPLTDETRSVLERYLGEAGQLY